MPETEIYKIKKEIGELPKKITGKEGLLLAQAIRVYENRLHTGISKVKSRAEVSGSGAKIYRQKGTGRARHGSLKAPIFVGGGVAHGPKGFRRKLLLTKKMRKKALEIALYLKKEQKKLILVKSLSGIKKTKDAQEFLQKIITKEFKQKKPQKITLVPSSKDLNLELAFRNIENCKIVYPGSLNAYNVFFGGVLIIEKNILEKFPKLTPLIKREKSKKLSKSKKTSKNLKKKRRSETISKKIDLKKS